MRSSIKTIFVMLLVVLATKAKAQQVPLFNQYYFAEAIAYPSSTVFSESRKISLVYRDQFGGLLGAPQNFAFAYSGRFNEKSGLNATITTADIGFTSQVKTSLGFGYKLFGEGNNGLALGTQVGLSFFSLNEERVNPENPIDNALAELLGQNGTSLSVDISATYRTGNWGIEVAVPTVINSSLSDDNYVQINDDNVPDVIAGVRYSWMINPDLTFTPYGGIRYRETLGGEVDVMGELNFKNKFRFLAGYRDNFGPTVGIGARVIPKLLFTYNYDFGDADIPFLADGFSEFGLHYELNDPKERVNTCETEGQAVVERIVDERIYDENLVNAEDKSKALCYLASLEEGKRKEKNLRAEDAYQALFKKIKDEEMAKQEAARVAALQAEKAKQDSIRAAQAEEQRRIEAAEEAERVRIAEAAAQAKQEEIKEALSLATESVDFNTSSSVLKESSFEALNEVAKLLIDNPQVKLSLEGFTDNTGNSDLNLELSKQRASAVKAYLVDLGVASDRITAEGYGDANPIADNSTREGRAQNRRVEMKIIK